MPLETMEIKRESSWLRESSLTPELALSQVHAQALTRFSLEAAWMMVLQL